MRSGLAVSNWVKRSAVIAAISMATIGLAACGDSDDDGDSGGGSGGEMVVNLTSFPDYLDPQISYTLEGWEALWPTYTPLLTYRHEPGDPGAEVIPGLAEDLPEISEDGLTATLTLRDGMKYSDGQPIVASDFPYAVERMFDLNSGGSSFYTVIEGAEDYQAGKADSISGIEADDDTGEITITLTQRSGVLPNILGLMFVAPVPQDTPKDEDQTKNPPPASGPFQITDVAPGRSFVMTPNPEFQTVLDAGVDIPEAQVDKITVEENKNNSAQVTAIEQGTVDFMVDPPIADRLPEVEAKYDGTQFRFEDSINTYYNWMNNQQPPFDDVRLRQAVNYAVDPEAMNRIFGGRMSPTQQILPPGMPGYEEYNLYPAPDMAKAQELFQEANPSDTEITYWTDDEPDRKRIGAYMQETLNEIGFDTTLKVIAGDIYFSTIGNLKTPDLDIGFTDWFQDFPHPDDFFTPLLGNILQTNNQNFSQTDIPELNTQIDELSQEPLEDVEDDYAALDRAYMEEAVWNPYGNELFTTFVSDRINFDETYHHLLFNQDYTSFQIVD